MSHNIESDERAFLAAVDAGPPDMAARLVYADWLTDHDREAEAGGWRWTAEVRLVPSLCVKPWSAPDFWPAYKYDTLRFPYLPPPSPGIADAPLPWGWNREVSPATVRGGFTSVLPDAVIAVYDAANFSDGGWRVLADEGWLWWCRTAAGALRLLVALWTNLPPEVAQTLSAHRSHAPWTRPILREQNWPRPTQPLGHQ